MSNVDNPKDVGASKQNNFEELCLAALLEYVERFGLTEKARVALVGQPPVTCSPEAATQKMVCSTKRKPKMKRGKALPEAQRERAEQGRLSRKTSS